MKKFKDSREKFEYMTTEKVSKLIGSICAPTIISMLITSFYNMVDTYFVGQIGSTSASAGVGIAFALMAFIQAMGFFFGHGSGNNISLSIGSGDDKDGKVEELAAVGFFSCFFFTAVMSVVLLIFINPFVRVLGATETNFSYAKDYIFWILIGMPFMSSSLVLNNQMRYEGSAFNAMVGTVTGALINIILDPVLIFGFGMGTAGAGLATIIGQIVSFFILLNGLKKNGNIAVEFRNFKPKAVYYRLIVRGGLPSLARQGISSVASAVLNIFAGIAGGDAAIAAMSIANRITHFCISAVIGYGQAFQPVCGMNFGAGKYGRVAEAFRFTVKTSLVFLIGVCALCFVFSPSIILFFRDDPAVAEIGARVLKYHMLVFWLSGFSMLTNMMLQTVNRTVSATVLGLSRQGIVFIPVLGVLVKLFGLAGLEISYLVSDAICFVLALPFAISFLKELKEGGDNLKLKKL